MVEREPFSNAILNLLLEEEVLSTSGKTQEELFERVYENVVQEKEIDEVISVETTFEQLCRNPGKRITTESVEEGTLKALEKAKRELPAQGTIEMQGLVEEAVDNVIRNFSAIRMSTGMTPEEAVRLAAKTVGGKSGGGICATNQRNRVWEVWKGRPAGKWQGEENLWGHCTERCGGKGKIKACSNERSGIPGRQDKFGSKGEWHQGNSD